MMSKEYIVLQSFKLVKTPIVPFVSWRLTMHTTNGPVFRSCTLATELIRSSALHLIDKLAMYVLQERK